MKKIIITVVIILIIIVGIYFWFGSSHTTVDIPTDEERATTTDEMVDEGNTKGDEEAGMKVIGKSVEGNDIVVHRFGEGEDEIVFVGGIHGGYSWNTALVSYELIDYLENNPDVIPDNIKVAVIPVLNPDGLEEVVGVTDGSFTKSDVPQSEESRISGRFNSNGVDLNRNFDCDWQETGVWQNREVNGGTGAFSEPESRAFRDYIEEVNPTAVVVWYSAAGGVFASSCHNGVLTETQNITDIYANASGYRAYQSFDFYEITGDMVNWLAKEEIPAISVLLSTHEDIEWNKNRAGIEALLEYYEN